MYKSIIIELVGKIHSVKDLKRIYKLVTYIYLHQETDA